MTRDLFDQETSHARRFINGPQEPAGNVPWITKEGFFDPAKFPIDSVLKHALSDDDREFRSGLNMLGSMYGHGRTEAGVFLLGLLVNCDDNWEKRIKIVEAMKGHRHQALCRPPVRRVEASQEFQHDPALPGGSHQRLVLHALGIDRRRL